MLRGVGGGGPREKKQGLTWWGDGRRMVGIGFGEVKGVWLMSCESDVGDPGAGDSESRSSVWTGGREPKPRDQKASQNLNNFPQTIPLISIHPSNQLSQLTLQLGINATFRSTSMNLGCMTLNGLTKILFITISNPSNSSGFGNPSESHDEGG